MVLRTFDIKKYICGFSKETNNGGWTSLIIKIVPDILSNYLVSKYEIPYTNEINI